MNKDKPSPYGYDNRPPFTLYQGDNGLWGLIDADGVRLPAEFRRSDDGEIFSRVPWESVCFDSQEGFELLSWYDPEEVWFNFTFNNPDYPSRWQKLLWTKVNGQFHDFRESYSLLLPEHDRWLIEALDSLTDAEKAIEARCGGDCDKEDKEMWDFLDGLVTAYPSLTDFKSMNQLIAPIIDHPDVSVNEKAILWNHKVYFDYCLNEYYLSIKTNE